MPEIGKRYILRFSNRAFFLLIVLFTFILIFSSAMFAERLPVKTYTVADGLLRDIIYKIKQDSRGFLWFCTPEGISRFDGAEVTNFTVRDGLPDRFVLDFLETRDGRIFIATGKGLARLNAKGQRNSEENPLFTVILPERDTAARITVLFEDRRGNIFVGTSDGLYKLAGNSLEKIELGADSIIITEMIEDRRGALWVGTGNGLFLLTSNGVERRFTTADNLRNENIASLLETNDGKIWIGLRPGRSAGLCILDNAPGNEKIEKCFSKDDGLPSEWITDLLQTSDGRIWTATVSGLCLWQGGESGKGCKTYDSKNDLCDRVFSLLEDKDGNLWTGSICGAKKIARYGFTTFTTEDGLDHNIVNSIFENSEGRFFVSTSAFNKRKVGLFDGEKFITVMPRLFESEVNAGWGWQQTIWQDRKGTWWIPTGDGIFRTPPVRFEELENVAARKQDSVVVNNEVFRLFEDSRGDIWLGGGTEKDLHLWRWERSTGEWYDHTPQIQIERLISAFAEDVHGNLWIGTGADDKINYYKGKLIRYRKGEFRIFDESNGVPRGWTRDLFVDSRGWLWIASTEDGLLRLDDTNSDRLNFTRYTPAEGLTSSATACVTEDEFGRIYVGTWRGIDRLDPETGQVKNFTTADGLPASFVENAYRDRSNNLWFSTSGGLARFRPEPVRTRKPPTILITNLRVGDEPHAVSILGEKEIAPLDLASNQNQISIDFLGLGASLGEKIIYEYRFADSDWTAVGDERTVNFANLKAGEYRFEVRAVTADKIYSAQNAAVSFRIAAPLWQRWWFIASVIFAAAILGYFFYRYRLNKLLEIERTRTRIASDLHDDIGTNLSKISLLSEIVNLQLSDANPKNKQMLASIAEISRESVTSMSDIVWAINPHRDSLNELVSRMRQYAEETFVEEGAAVRFDAPADGENLKLSMDVRRDIYLIFKEVIANAAKHSDCRKIEIDFYIEHGTIFLQIKDDGRGFDLSQKCEGNGLENIKRRAAANGGRLEIESETDQGTTIKIEIPQS